MKTEKDHRSSLKEFFKREYHNMVGYVRYRLENTFFNADPEDIVQDVALSVFTNLSLDTPVENVAGYFYRAIRNRIVDIYRKPSKVVSIERFTNENDENYLEKSLAEPEDLLMDQNEKMQALMMEAINKLSADQQAIIYETEFGGHSFQELSDRWNIPIGTLLARKSRAISKLQEILKDVQFTN